MTTPGTPRIEQPFSPNKVGGSSAKLMLVTEGMEQRFRKEERRRPSKLKAQYEWLHQRQGLPHIPKVFESVETPQSFSYEMRFYGDSMPLVTWIHQHSQEEALEDFRSTLARRKSLTETSNLARESKALYDAFHIGYQGPFATINGLRLGAEATVEDYNHQHDEGGGGGVGVGSSLLGSRVSGMN